MEFERHRQQRQFYTHLRSQPDHIRHRRRLWLGRCLGPPPRHHHHRRHRHLHRGRNRPLRQNLRLEIEPSLENKRRTA